MAFSLQKIMAQAIHVEFTGQLQEFVTSRISDNGFYHTASEYIRDLVRKDFEREEEQLKESLYQELAPALDEPLSACTPLDIDDTIKRSRERRAKLK